MPYRGAEFLGRGGLSSRVHHAAIARLCNELTTTESVFPGADLRQIVYFVGSS
jgi:hypothetical protein